MGNLVDVVESIEEVLIESFEEGSKLILLIKRDDPRLDELLLRTEELFVVSYIDG